MFCIEVGQVITPAAENFGCRCLGIQIKQQRPQPTSLGFNRKMDSMRRLPCSALLADKCACKHGVPPTGKQLNVSTCKCVSSAIGCSVYLLHCWLQRQRRNHLSPPPVPNVCPITLDELFGEEASDQSDSH